MKYLEDKEAWERWAEANAPVLPPKSYPCFAYWAVSSWQFEEEDPVYLYKADIERMAKEITA